jgi:hypothetical protein
LIFNNLEAANRYAVATGNWNSTSTWSSSSGGSSGASVPGTSDNVYVQGGFTVTINANTTALTLLSIASGSTLTVSPNFTVSATTITVNGTYNNGSTGAITKTTMTFGSAAVYNHNINSGTIPSATWNATSTCSIKGVTSTAPSGGSQTFGNLTWNCASQSGDVSFSVDLNITGNLTIMNSNSNQVRPNDGADHVIGGNYTHSGGNIRWARNSNTTLTVNGSMSITGGEVQLTNGTDSGVVYLKGNFSHTGGSLTETGTGTNAAGNIVFNGSSAQTFTSGGSVTQNINYEVISGAIVQMAAASTAVHGNGFSLLSGGTLDIKSADGITKYVSTTADSSKGNVRTLNRSYSSNASYIYSGAAQTVGNGLTGARNLTLSGSGTKTFAAANFTSNVLGVSVDLNINTDIIASIPNSKSITVSSKLYLGGVGKINGTYGSTTSAATYKTNTFFAATTGIVTVTVSALPVTLTSFTAKPTTDNKVSLGWVTSTESVNKGFRIERQAGSTANKYEQIGFVGSKAKEGNSQNTLTYNFIDAAPKVGATSFYRLVQEDLDGKLTYSEVRVVKLNGQSVSMVFPNPSNGAVNISRTADGKKMNIQVIDQSGKIISEVNNITDANYRMNILQSGIYSIKMVYPETGEQSIQRIVVQK